MFYDTSMSAMLGRPVGQPIVRFDCGQAPLGYAFLCRARPSSKPFAVFAGRELFDDLSRIFLILSDASETGNVPTDLAWWKDVNFYESADVPSDAVVFAASVRGRSESVDEWKERAWLGVLANLGVMPYREQGP